MASKEESIVWLSPESIAGGGPGGPTGRKSTFLPRCGGEQENRGHPTPAESFRAACTGLAQQRIASSRDILQESCFIHRP